MSGIALSGMNWFLDASQAGEGGWCACQGRRLHSWHRVRQARVLFLTAVIFEGQGRKQMGKSLSRTHCACGWELVSCPLQVPVAQCPYHLTDGGCMRQDYRLGTSPHPFLCSRSLEPSLSGPGPPGAPSPGPLHPFSPYY